MDLRKEDTVGNGWDGAAQNQVATSHLLRPNQPITCYPLIWLPSRLESARLIESCEPRSGGSVEGRKTCFLT